MRPFPSFPLPFSVVCILFCCFDHLLHSLLFASELFLHYTHIYTHYFWVCAVCVHTKSFQSCPAFCNSMDCYHQAPLSMGFSRQEYWSGLPFPSPRDLPDRGMEPDSLMPPALVGFFTTSASWEVSTITIQVLQRRR